MSPTKVSDNHRTNDQVIFAREERLLLTESKYFKQEIFYQQVCVVC